MKLTPDLKNANPVYLHRYFCTDLAQEYIASHALTTGVPHINLGILRATPVLLPPKNEQDAFARFATEVEALLCDLTSAERVSNELFHSLVHRAFRGELTAASEASNSAMGGIPQRSKDNRIAASASPGGPFLTEGPVRPRRGAP